MREERNISFDDLSVVIVIFVPICPNSNLLNLVEYLECLLIICLLPLIIHLILKVLRHNDVFNEVSLLEQAVHF